MPSLLNQLLTNEKKWRNSAILKKMALTLGLVMILTGLTNLDTSLPYLSLSDSSDKCSTYLTPRNSDSEEEHADLTPHILFVLDDGYGGNCEYILEIFNNFGWNITTAAVTAEITGCSYVNYATFQVDQTLDHIDISDFDCVSILPGESYENLNVSNTFFSLLAEANEQRIVITAWCRAVGLLAQTPLISGRIITGHDDYVVHYAQAGAFFQSQVPPIVDGNIITSVRSRFYRQETCDLIKSTVETYSETPYGFSTYFGGTGDEKGIAASLNYLGDTVIDSEGNIILVGRTASVDFPIQNALQNHSNGGIDLFIAKFSPQGDLLFSTYFGGSSHEWATSVVVDSQDNILFAGITKSLDFPVVNPMPSIHLDGYEGLSNPFFTKIDPTGQEILFSSLFGGTGNDWCYALAIDHQDNFALTGTTYSWDFPVMQEIQEENIGGRDIFVSKFGSDGQSLIFSTFLGGESADSGRGLGFDELGNLYLTGEISASTWATENAPLFDHQGNGDAFVACFSPSGDLSYFTYLGGTSLDRGNDLTVDAEGYAVVTGYTFSDDFPVENALYSEPLGNTDIFLTKIAPGGEAWEFSTYLGGEGQEKGYAVTLDGTGNIHVVGETSSETFPAINNEDFNFTTGGSDGFLIMLNSGGTDLLFASVLGGSENDVAVATASLGLSYQIVVGFTYSEDLPSLDAYQEDYADECDFFLQKISLPPVEFVVDSSAIPGFTPIYLMLGMIGISALIICKTKLRSNPKV